MPRLLENGLCNLPEAKVFYCGLDSFLIVILCFPSILFIPCAPCDMIQEDDEEPL